MKPNTLQQEIIKYVSGSECNKRILLVEAPPGTGKTYTSIASAIEFLKKHRELQTSRKVLILTFSKNAKAQLDKQLDELESSRDIQNRIEISNFHSFFQKYVWAYSTYLGLGNNLTILSPSQRINQIKASFNFIEWDVLGEGEQSKLIDWIDNILENAHNLDFYTGKGKIKNYLKYKSQFKDGIIELNKSGYVSFSDFAYYMNELIDKSPKFLTALRFKYPLIILDEYQDSSDVQDIIVKKIIGDNNQAIFFADSKQMIYEWRGASKNRLSEIEKYFAGDIEKRNLQENMRFKNSKELVKFLDDTRLGKESPIISSDVLVESKFTVPKGKNYTHQLNLTNNYTYYNVLQNLKRDMKKNDMANTSIGILCRSNELTNYLKNKLREDGKVWSKDISNNEEEHNMVGDFNSFLDFIKDSGIAGFNDEYYRYVFKFIFYVIFDDNIASIKRTSINTITTDKLSRATNPILKIIKSNIVNALLENDYIDGLRQCLKYLKNKELKVNKDMYMLLNDILTLSNINQNSVTNKFIQYQHKRAYKMLKGIYILTMHQSKGREFDIVYVVNEPKIKPEDNIFYVAVTRTKHKLCIISKS